MENPCAGSSVYLPAGSNAESSGDDCDPRNSAYSRKADPASTSSSFGGDRDAVDSAYSRKADPASTSSPEIGRTSRFWPSDPIIFMWHRNTTELRAAFSVDLVVSSLFLQSMTSFLWNIQRISKLLTRKPPSSFCLRWDFILERICVRIVAQFFRGSSSCLTARKICCSVSNLETIN